MGALFPYYKSRAVAKSKGANSMTRKIAQRDTHARLEDLRAVLEKLYIEIERSDLSDNEISIQSGYCKLRGGKIIFLDKNLPLEIQETVLLKIMRNFDLDDIYIASWIREHYERKSS